MSRVAEPSCRKVTGSLEKPRAGSKSRGISRKPAGRPKRPRRVSPPPPHRPALRAPFPAVHCPPSAGDEIRRSRGSLEHAITGRDLRNRLAASLAAHFGPYGEELRQFGLKPRVRRLIRQAPEAAAN